MKRWHGALIGASLVALIGGSSMLFFVPVGGAVIAGVPPVFNALTGWVVCPGAVSIERRQYNHGRVTTSSTGGTGHQQEWTCTYDDGRRRVVPNEEIALKGLGASFAVAGVCCGVVMIPLLIAAAVIGAKLVKPKAP